MPTNTSEAGLETLIVASLTRAASAPANDAQSEGVQESGAASWTLGESCDYDRDFAVDLRQLTEFLVGTQPKAAETLHLADPASPKRLKFISRLQGEITKRGVADVLNHGVKDGAVDVALYYPLPSPGNDKAAMRFASNRFSVTRQLRYSKDSTHLALDLCLFINGLPVATFELKNSFTKQTVKDAVEQYKRDRDPRERLFELGRCLVHFAVDDQSVEMCTHLQGGASWFLPFNQGHNEGAGNPPNPQGIATNYLWRRILRPRSLADILENFARLIETTDPKTNKKKRQQIFPRYHQLEVVRRLTAAVAKPTTSAEARRFLIQHSAGSGKSNSISWLSLRLAGLLQGDGAPAFDSVIVVTDRVILDRQLRDNVKAFTSVNALVGHAKDSGDLRKFIEGGKKIIVSTVQKFPHILEEIGSEHSGRRFAIIIDEAHSGQGGRTAAALNLALTKPEEEPEEEDDEDRINQLIDDLIKRKKLVPNAAYFAFTATPKNRTLELFGTPFSENGVTKFRPFHAYSMKQAIEEGFIRDVLAHYTPVQSYYKLIKKIEGDPEFDKNKAQKKLRLYVEGHDHAIGVKAGIMVEHFHRQVLDHRRVSGHARAMVVTGSIRRAIEYFKAIEAALVEIKSPYRAIVAFSGEHEVAGVKVSEASLNGFPSNDIPDKIQEDPYRILICADKFQTGYDEPLLQTMYVDKPLSGVKAVQTLSRLNRARPDKDAVFVLDFYNDADAIRDAFAPYYRTTLLGDATDPNKLNDLQAALDKAEVYAWAQVDELVGRYLDGVPRDKLDPILDECRNAYKTRLDVDAQVKFKGEAKAFLRTYGFLSAVLPFGRVEWEKLSIFLALLVPKLPAPPDEDLAKGILENIDMESYRVERRATMKILLPDENAELAPVPTGGGGHKPEPELDRLSAILKSFNDMFGNIPWEDRDRIHRLMTQDIPRRVAQDEKYKAAMANSDRQNARVEHDHALLRVMMSVMRDDTQLFKQFLDNSDFKRWLQDKVFDLTYRPGDTPPTP